VSEVFDIPRSQVADFSFVKNFIELKEKQARALTQRANLAVLPRPLCLAVLAGQTLLSKLSSIKLRKILNQKAASEIKEKTLPINNAANC